MIFLFSSDFFLSSTSGSHESYCSFIMRLEWMNAQSYCKLELSTIILLISHRQSQPQCQQVVYEYLSLELRVTSIPKWHFLILKSVFVFLDDWHFCISSRVHGVNCLSSRRWNLEDENNNLISDTKVRSRCDCSSTNPNLFLLEGHEFGGDLIHGIACASHVCR